MSWIELKINVPQTALEQISSYLFALGCEGINVTEEGIIIYFSSHKWSEETQIGLIEFVKQILPGFGIRDINIIAVADQDWNKGWKEYFKPIRVTSRIVIKPPWEKYRKRIGDIVVTINPQMAFGTGHHESTQLVIIELEKWLKPKMQILDVGAGSGILSIIAEKLGAELVLGIDNDIIALRNAQENVHLNQSIGNIRFFNAQLEQLNPSEYDLIVANINRNVLLLYSSLFPEFMKLKSKIILSGILRSDESTVVNKFISNGFKLVSKNAKKEWLALVFELENKKSENEKSNHRYRDEFDDTFDRSIE